jgi:hypothetical protein
MVFKFIVPAATPLLATIASQLIDYTGDFEYLGEIFPEDPNAGECIRLSAGKLKLEAEEVIKKLKSILSGNLPSSPNDFTYGR